MQWKVPKEGEWRNVKHFLWFPRRINGKVKWLEVAEYSQCYSIICGWINWKWIEN